MVRLATGRAVVPNAGRRRTGNGPVRRPLAAHDLLVVVTADGRQVQVPFVSELVPQIDADGIVLTPPGGLFDDPVGGDDDSSEAEG